MKILCIGRNYADHISELGNARPDEPVIFLKPDTALLAKDQDFYIPEFSSDVQHEIEIVVKIAKTGKYIDEKFAANYYEEITVGIDFTARDLQQKLKEKGLPWEKAKAFDNSAVIGDFTSKKIFSSLESLTFELQKNKQTVQTGDTSLMLWSIDAIVAHVSRFFTLKTGDLIFTGTPPHLHFTITANAGSNEGGLDGDVVVEGDHASFRQEQCRLDFVREGARIRVKQQGYDADCGGGLGVYYGADYIPTASFKARPQPDLLSVGVLDDARQNAAAQTLLGKDYDALVGTINLGVSEDDQDELGAKVDQYFVRGLANTNAAIVMRKGELLWIGLLVFDTHDQVRLRYYTNVPAWKMQLPKTIQAWRERFDPRPPTDLMP